MMNGTTAEALRGLDDDALYAALDGDGRGSAQAEIVRRTLEGLPEAIAEVIAELAERGALDLSSGWPSAAAFEVTTDYDDGPAWDTDAAVVLADGRQVPVGFDRSTVADQLIELSEHNRPHVGQILVVAVARPGGAGADAMPQR